MQCIHIINDEKFVDGLISNYEALFPNKNRYVVISYNKKQEFTFVKNTKMAELVYYKSILFYLDEIVNKESLILIHGLDRIKLKVINRYKDSLKIGVHFWGADIYLLPKFSNALFLRQTKKLFKRRSSIKTLFFNKLRGFYYQYMYKRTLKYVSVYSTVVETEKNLICNYLPNASYAKFNYADVIGLKLNDFVINQNAVNVLIGNSSSYTNNHLDLIDKIQNIKALQNSEKIIPLNYGDNKYAEDIINNIRIRRLENFRPLTDFLPFEQYLEILSCCSIAVMGHQRQQAVGNIIICIWLGMRVFLSKRNPVYDDYKKRGMIIFSIENDLPNIQSISLLETQHIQNNRSIIESLYSKKETFNNITHFIKLMDEQHQ